MGLGVRCGSVTPGKLFNHSLPSQAGSFQSQGVALPPPHHLHSSFLSVLSTEWGGDGVLGALGKAVGPALHKPRLARLHSLPYRASAVRRVWREQKPHCCQEAVCNTGHRVCVSVSVCLCVCVTALLRYNSHSIRLTHLQYVIQSF